MKKRFAGLIIVGLIISLFAGCGQADLQKKDIHGSEGVPLEGMTNIQLSDAGIMVDGSSISADTNAAVYAANDIVFYLADQGFTYGEGEVGDEHTQEEADAHTVVHITKPGSYAISGSLSKGQIAVNLGEEAEEDPKAVVNLYLNGVDVNCDVAPAVIFYNVYECGQKDEEAATKDVDTSAAGANVVIVDDTINTVNGSYVARIYKSYTLNEAGTEVVDNKKLHKYDGAFYSKMSLNVDGGEKDTGILNINAENEGLDSELHLTINGGTININSGNDGINTNEDNISVTTINDGQLNIVVNGSTGEGDGIDSNGWLVINGGTLISSACDFSADAGIDSDMGIYINGGNVMATGNMLDRIAGNEQPYVIFMSRSPMEGHTTYTVKDAKGNAVAEYTPENGFMYFIVSDADLAEGDSYTLWNGTKQVAEGMNGMDGMRGPGMGRPEGEMYVMPEGGFPAGMEPPKMPEGMAPGERPKMPEGMAPEERPKMPEGMAPEERSKIPERMVPGDPDEEISL